MSREQDELDGQAAMDEANNRIVELEARLAEVMAALEGIVWDGDAHGNWCRFCKLGYPTHQADCIGEKALAKGRP